MNRFKNKKYKNEGLIIKNKRGKRQHSNGGHLLSSPCFLSRFEISPLSILLGWCFKERDL